MKIAGYAYTYVRTIAYVTQILKQFYAQAQHM